jgi:hypothetical protein
MAIRTISNVTFSRNPAFWQRRRRRGDDIHLTRMKRLVAILYGLRPRSLSSTR